MQRPFIIGIILLVAWSTPCLAEHQGLPTFNPYTDKALIRPIIPDHPDAAEMAGSSSTDDPAPVKKSKPKTPAEYRQLIKEQITKAWEQDMHVPGPPIGTIVALLFDKQGDLRYASILESPVNIPKDKHLLRAAWTAGRWPGKITGKAIKPVVITW